MTTNEYWDFASSLPIIQVEKLDGYNYKLKISNSNTHDTYETFIKTYDFESELINLDNLQNILKLGIKKEQIDNFKCELNIVGKKDSIIANIIITNKSSIFKNKTISHSFNLNKIKLEESVKHKLIIEDVIREINFPIVEAGNKLIKININNNIDKGNPTYYSIINENVYMIKTEVKSYNDPPVNFNISNKFLTYFIKKNDMENKYISKEDFILINKNDQIISKIINHELHNIILDYLCELFNITIFNINNYEIYAIIKDQICKKQQLKICNYSQMNKILSDGFKFKILSGPYNFNSEGTVYIIEQFQ